jgi:hypothetical protein
MAAHTIPQSVPYGQPSPIFVDGDVAYIALGRGFETVIDADDLPIVEGLSWRAMITHTGHVYASHWEGAGKVLLLHRAILKPERRMQVDHIDGDGLNNRRRNLRIATPAQNQANKAAERRNKLGVKGVHHSGTAEKPFLATIKPGGKTIHLGRFATKEEAAAAYIGAAKVLWGEFARK